MSFSPGKQGLSAHCFLASKRVLRRAFPDCRFSQSFPDRYGRYDWGTYVRGMKEPTRLEQFLHALTQYLYLVDDFDECFALGRHGQFDPTAGGYARTQLGEILHRAKPYGPQSGDRAAADELVGRLAAFVAAHPTYSRADALVPVPPSNPNKPFDLPTYLAAQLAGV
jgi:hypothetical protein